MFACRCQKLKILTKEEKLKLDFVSLLKIINSTEIKSVSFSFNITFLLLHLTVILIKKLILNCDLKKTLVCIEKQLTIYT